MSDKSVGPSPPSELRLKLLKHFYRGASVHRCIKCSLLYGPSVAPSEDGLCPLCRGGVVHDEDDEPIQDREETLQELAEVLDVSPSVPEGVAFPASVSSRPAGDVRTSSPGSVSTLRVMAYIWNHQDDGVLSSRDMVRTLNDWRSLRVSGFSELSSHEVRAELMELMELGLIEERPKRSIEINRLALDRFLDLMNDLNGRSEG